MAPAGRFLVSWHFLAGSAIPAHSRSIETRDEFIPKLEFSPRKTRSQAKASDGIPVTPTRSKKTAGNVSSPFSDAEPDLDRLTIDDDDEDEDDDDGKRPHNVLYMSPLSPPSSDLAHTNYQHGTSSLPSSAVDQYSWYWGRLDTRAPRLDCEEERWAKGVRGTSGWISSLSVG